MIEGSKVSRYSSIYILFDIGFDFFKLFNLFKFVSLIEKVKRGK